MLSLLLGLSFVVQEVKGIGSITLQCCWGSIELGDIRLVNPVLHVKCGSLGEMGRRGDCSVELVCACRSPMLYKKRMRMNRK